jgi:hypothetical protein
MNEPVDLHVPWPFEIVPMNLSFFNRLIEKHLRSVVYGGTDGYGARWRI